MTEEPRTPEPDDTAPTEPQTPKSDAPPPSSPGVRRLTRSSSDKLIGGVAGGALALWAIPRRRRVGLVPVALWGGLFVGYVAYAAATG